MTNDQLFTRIAGLRDKFDCDTLANDLNGTKADCEGTAAEQFISGYENALDSLDEKSLTAGDEAEFVRFATHYVYNEHCEAIDRAKLTRELNRYAMRNGRNWKSKLRHAWETGSYSEADDSQVLQSARNSSAFGPRGLAKFRANV